MKSARRLNILADVSRHDDARDTKRWSPLVTDKDAGHHPGRNKRVAALREPSPRPSASIVCAEAAPSARTKRALGHSSERARDSCYQALKESVRLTMNAMSKTRLWAPTVLETSPTSGAASPSLSLGGLSLGSGQREEGSSWSSNHPRSGSSACPAGQVRRSRRTLTHVNDPSL